MFLVHHVSPFWQVSQLSWFAHQLVSLFFDGHAMRYLLCQWAEVLFCAMIAIAQMHFIMRLIAWASTAIWAAGMLAL
jgi:hypothetical protein